jgi:hypothetical protein
MTIVGFYSGPDKYYVPPPFPSVNIFIVYINSRKFFLHTTKKLDGNTASDFYSYTGKKSLNESNVLLSKEGIFVDWLATFPIFYSENLNIISSYGGLFPKCEIETDAFSYFTFSGRPLLHKTFYKNVHILQSDEFIKFHRKFKVHKRPIKSSQFKFFANPAYILGEISTYINSNLSTNKKFSGKAVVIPLSGGNDSRLISSLISGKYKSNCISFTYQIGFSRFDCQEVKLAQKVAKSLDIEHQIFDIKSSSLDYIIWHYLFGPFYQFNGCYYINVMRSIPFLRNSYFLSGIIGDIISGKHENINGDFDKLLLRSKDGSYVNQEQLKRANFYRVFSSFIDSEKSRNLSVQELAVRLKIQQLSFLISVPMHFGATVLSPFTEKKIFKHICNLSIEDKKNRLWQKLYFIKNKINFRSSRFFYINFTSYRLLNSMPIKIRIKLIPLNFMNFGMSPNNLFFSFFMLFPFLSLPLFYPPLARLLNPFGLYNPSLRTEKLISIYFHEKK